jgi:Secretion system C-terminal sorting domain
MNRIVLISLSVASMLHFVPTFGQNRIPNSGFETVSAMPYQGNQLNLASPWSNCNGNYSSFMVGTPDLFHANANNQMDVPVNFMADCNSHTGNAITGIVTWNDNYSDYREYMSVQLLAPLVPGQDYIFSFWWSHGSNLNYKYITNNLGVYFSVNPVTQTGWNIVNVTPQYELTSTSYTSGWTQLVYSFTATTACNYVTVGNFKSDAQTQHSLVGSGQPYGYFFLDDFCLLEQDISFAAGDCSVPYTGIGIAETRSEPKAEVQTFPNPSQGLVTFVWASGLNPEKLEIFNLAGEVVYSSTMPVNSDNTITVNTALAAGTYFYCLSSQEGKIGAGIIIIGEQL